NVDQHDHHDRRHIEQYDVVDGAGHGADHRDVHGLDEHGEHDHHHAAAVPAPCRLAHGLCAVRLRGTGQHRVPDFRTHRRLRIDDTPAGTRPLRTLPPHLT